MVRNSIPAAHWMPDPEVIREREELSIAVVLPSQAWMSCRQKFFAMFGNLIYEYDVTRNPGYEMHGDDYKLSASICGVHKSVLIGKNESEDSTISKVSKLFMGLVNDQGWAPYHKEEIKIFEEAING